MFGVHFAKSLSSVFILLLSRRLRESSIDPILIWLTSIRSPYLMRRRLLRLQFVTLSSLKESFIDLCACRLLSLYYLTTFKLSWRLGREGPLHMGFMTLGSLKEILIDLGICRLLSLYSLRAFNLPWPL